MRQPATIQNFICTGKDGVRPVSAIVHRTRFIASLQYSIMGKEKEKINKNKSPYIYIKKIRIFANLLK